MERDREMVAVLEGRRTRGSPSLAANAARLDLASVAGTRPLTLVGNLPYHLTSSILFEALEQHRDLEGVRVHGPEGGRRARRRGGGDAGRRSSSRCCSGCGSTRPSSGRCRGPPFTRRPRWTPRCSCSSTGPAPRADVGDDAFFRKVVKAGFSQRRKTLSNALQSDRELGDAGRIRAALAEAGIESTRRAETLSVADFARLARALRQPPGHG